MSKLDNTKNDFSVFNLYEQEDFGSEMINNMADFKMSLYKKWGFPKQYNSLWENWELNNLNKIQNIEFNSPLPILGIPDEFKDNYYIYFEFKQPKIYLGNKLLWKKIHKYNTGIYSIYIFSSDTNSCLLLINENSNKYYKYINHKDEL